MVTIHNRGRNKAVLDGHKDARNYRLFWASRPDFSVSIFLSQPLIFFVHWKGLSTATYSLSCEVRVEMKGSSVRLQRIRKYEQYHDFKTIKTHIRRVKRLKTYQSRPQGWHPLFFHHVLKRKITGRQWEFLIILNLNNIPNYIFVMLWALISKN